jgi:hypothetical protein
MFIYNVTVKTDATISEAWERWMLEEHMPELLSTGLFTECRLSRLTDTDDDDDSPTYSAQYTCSSRAEYERYIAKHAAEMRQKGLDKFGGGFVAFRSVMDVLGVVKA